MKTKNDNEYLNNLRHSMAHLLAAAVVELWPNTLRTIGPSIENGFYYDFDFGKKKISEEDFPKIETKMREILKSWEGFERIEVSVRAAQVEYKSNPYKLELIDELSKESKRLTFYKSGKYFDLCRGGHVKNPKEELQNFKLLSIAGAYWRGSEKNKMLTRIYGTAFPTKDALDDYLQQQEDAKKNDHKRLGPQLGLFMFHHTAPGMPYWLPKGVIVYNELINFWREEHAKRGYQEIVSPLINKKELYETSGHWDHYKENMFISETEEGETYALKPMNCPNAMVVFGSRNRSYRELPLRLGDTDTLHRFERSGTLNGLFRVREFRQDDAHIFVSEDQIEQEFNSVLEITKLFYSLFNMEYRFRLGTRPDDLIGDKASWDKAEATLEIIAKKSGVEYFIGENEGAFYGPKIDILMKDALGREWQTGTIQLDFQMPKRFDLKYTDEEGAEKVPAVIHRVIYGSLERFLGILIEHTGGALPIWISPVQVKILPISDKNLEYAKKVFDELKTFEIRVEIDERNETLQAKIRDAQVEKVPYMVILGGREQEQNLIAVRNRTKGDMGQMDLEKFVKDLKLAIKNKVID